MRRLARIVALLSSILLPTELWSDQIHLHEVRIDTTPARRAFATTRRSESKLGGTLQTNLNARSASSVQPYLIQVTGPIQAKSKNALTKAGVQIVGYVPDNALLVRATPAAIKQALALPEVQWVGDYQADYRIQSEILTLARQSFSQASTQNLSRAKAFAAPEAPTATVPPSRTSDYAKPPVYDEPKMLTVVAFDASELTALSAQISTEGGTVVSSSSTRHGGLLRVRLAPTAATRLAELPSVRWIEPYREPKLMNNVAVQGPRMNVQTVWTNFGLTGSNQIIAVCDTGLDSGDTNTIHPDFAGRIYRAFALGRPYTGAWRDNNGHGTHVSGSVLGSGAAYGSGLYRGVAYDAKLVMQSVEDNMGYLSGIPNDLNDLFLQAYTNDARIHSDSWGASADGAYDSMARECDEFVWNHPDMLLLFAAGNDGADSLPTGNPDGVVDEDSLGTPATAKNVLTVGAAENARTNGGYSTQKWTVFGYTANPLSNDMISASYDGVNQGMAAFSSRGPCDDGRTKPDIVAPGTDILSVKSRPAADNLWGAVAGTTNYAYCGGTSMATPLTAGAAGLVRQYLVERRGISNPSAALIKAMMLNAARSLAPGQYGTGAGREIPDQARPNNAEGWGHVNLGETCFPTDGRTNALYTGQAATGETNTYTFISTHTNTLSIVLAWSDYPGELAAARALVNDLDLRVIAPNGQVHLGNGIPGGDRINNVEGLDVFPLTPGTTIVQVVGYNVPQGTNQPYALVLRESPQTYEFKLQQAIHSPEWPTNLQTVALLTYIQAGVGGIGGITNFYRINAGSWVEAPAVAVNGYGPGVVFQYDLAGQTIGTRVDYYAVAYDGVGAPYYSSTNTFYVSDLVAYVKTNGTPVPPYNSWDTAATNINDAVNAVIPGGIVWVTNGVYDGGVVIQKSVTVKSVNGAMNTIIDGRGTNRCVKMDGIVYSVLDGFTLTNGVTPNGDILGDKAGGGVLLREYAVVQNCIITGNRGMFGGGAACYNSKFRYEAGTISNCVIEGNVADTYYGGGVRLAYGGYVTHSLIRDNEGFGSAGGVYFEGLGGYLENSVVVGNTATNFSVYEPVAFGTGGGIETYGGGYIVNCTVVSNQSVYRGGINFYNMGRMMNTVVWSNRQETGYEADDDTTHGQIALRADYSCAPGLNLVPLPGYDRGFGNITNHPQFANFNAGNYRLTMGSPCRDRGTNVFWEALAYEDYQYRDMTKNADFDQTPRVKNNLVDMGAYEFDYIDTNAPVVTALGPIDNDVMVDPYTKLTMTFGEPVKAGAGTVYLYRSSGALEQQFPADGAAVSVVWNVVTISPTQMLAFTNAYYVLIDTNAIYDYSTNWYAGISSTSVWNFATRNEGSYITNTLRVDFGSNTSPVEMDGNWQEFSVDSFSEEQPSLRNYTVGTSTVSVSINGWGVGILSGRDRAQPSADAGALTYSSVYRDMATVNSGDMTLIVTGVQANASIALRVWTYDYSFAGGSVFSLTDVTDGRSVLIGQTTNVTGTAAKPTNNVMYSIAGTVRADADGALELLLSGTSSARINGLELAVTEEIVVTTNTLTVASAYGMASPPVGITSYVSGSSVTCMITNTPPPQDSTQLVCTGWAGTGSVPASGSGTSVTFTIANNSSITWLWVTNVAPVVVSNLTVDSSFTPPVGDRITDLDIDPSNRILIVGAFTNIGAIHRQSIARLHADGAVDTNLTLGAGYGDHDWANAALCHTNGKSFVGGTLAGNLVRFNAEGTVDTNFPMPGVTAADNAIDTILELADGRILLGGPFVMLMDEEHPGVARLNVDGTIDSSFTTTLDNFSGGFNSVYALAQQADGKLIMGGEFWTINLTNHLNIGRLNANGTLDDTFNHSISGLSARVNTLLVQTNGGLIAGGFFSYVSGYGAMNLTRFTPAGAVDMNFAVYPNNRVNALLALPDGRTLIGGEFTAVNSAAHPGLAMLKSNGTLDDSFDMGVSGSVAGVVHALHLDADNGILVAGEFDYLGGVARANLGRLMLGSSTNTPPSTNNTATSEYWAGINQDGHARNASGVTLAGDLRVRWARSLTNFNDALLQARTNYAGQRGNGLAIRDGRILALVPNATNPLAQAAGQYFASFGTFSLHDGAKLHETITPHLGAGTRGAAALQDSDTTYGYVNFYWNREDTVFTGYGADIARSYAFDAYSGTLAPNTPFSPMAQSPNGSGYFAMTYDNPLVYARGGLNTHYSFSRARGGIVGQGELQIDAMKHYNAYLVSGWDVVGFTMTDYTDDTCFPVGLGTKLTSYRFTNSPYGVTTKWTANIPSNTFAGFGLHHVRGAPRPIALGTDGRIYYYGFRNTMSGSTPTAADYASGMRLFAVSATNGQPLFEINTGWNPDGDAGLASTATWSTERYHFFLPQISVLSNRVMVLHPQVNKGSETNLWTRGRLFCFDTASTSLAWSVTYTNNAFNAKVRMDDVVYNITNNASPNCMWGDNTEQAVQLTIAGSHGYVVDPSIQGGGASGPLQLTVYRYALADGSVTVTNLVPTDENANTITAYAERMVNLNDNTNRVALRELAAVDGALVALVDVDLKAQALVVIEGSTTATNDLSPAAAILAPYAGIPPAVQAFNDHRGTTSAKTNLVPVLNRLGTPQMKIYDTGTAVPFDAAGSVDPDGGALTYSWSFGDGSSGSGAQTSHVYASWGGAPEVSNVTVRLTVTDNEGNTNTTLRTIWVRDVGASVTTTLTASADGYVYTAGTSSNSNFGSAQDLEIRRVDASGITQEIAYLKFDLTGVDVATVTDAVLRVYVMTPQDFQLEAHATSNGWTESTLRGSNAPPIGARLGDVITSRYDPIGTWARAFHQWVEFPVLVHVKDTAYGTERSFAIVATNANTAPLELASRNNSTWPNSAPQLILRTGSAGYGGPSITSAPAPVIVYTNTTTQTLSIAASSSIGATNLAYSWRQVSGPARAVIGTRHSIGSGSSTVAIPPGGGVYVFRGLVDDGLLYNEAQVTFQETAAVSFAFTASVNNVSWGSVSPTGGVYTSGTVVQVTAAASNGYSFVNWTGDASGSANPLNLTLDADKTISATFATNEPLPAVTNTLTVVSAYGTPVPAGANLYTNGSVVSVSVGGSPVDQGTTQIVATGWTLAGNNPVSGSATNFSLTLTNDATLTWQWQTNVLLQAAAGANGTVSSTGGWYALGGSVTVTAVPNSGYAFTGWSGDVSGDTNANPLTLTMDRARSITANLSTNAAGGNGLVWRVDFNGTGNDTLATSNFTGWAISSTSRTQSFANVDGGSISSSITVRLLGSGTFSAYQRNMNAGSATNLYRDGGQNTASLMTLALSNLAAGVTYSLRVWYFDDEFSIGTTQSYVNVTDGGSIALGTLTNTASANATGGHATLPSALYDARYCLTASVTAGTNGDIQVSIAPNTGNTKINAFELMAPGGGEPPVVTNSLVVSSVYGMATPFGTNLYTNGTSVTCTLTNSPLTLAATQYFCIGWTGSGSVPASGSGTSVTFTITNDSTIAWQWETNYLLTAAANAHGQVSPTSGWYRSYSNASIAATADTYFHLTNWTGDVTSYANPLVVLMDGPKSVTASFDEDLYTNGVPATWLATHNLSVNNEGALSDTDNDGMAAWEERIADTIPTNFASRLLLSSVRAQGSDSILAWDAKSGRVYAVYFSTSLVNGIAWPLVAETAGGSLTDALHTAEREAFYQIKVRLQE